MEASEISDFEKANISVVDWNHPALNKPKFEPTPGKFECIGYIRHNKEGNLVVSNFQTQRIASVVNEDTIDLGRPLKDGDFVLYEADVVGLGDARVKLIYGIPLVGFLELFPGRPSVADVALRENQDIKGPVIPLSLRKLPPDSIEPSRRVLFVNVHIRPRDSMVCWIILAFDVTRLSRYKDRALAALFISDEDLPELHYGRIMQDRNGQPLLRSLQPPHTIWSLVGHPQLSSIQKNDRVQFENPSGAGMAPKIVSIY